MNTVLLSWLIASGSQNVVNLHIICKRTDDLVRRTGLCGMGWRLVQVYVTVCLGGGGAGSILEVQEKGQPPDVQINL